MKRQKNSLFLILIILATVLVIAVFGSDIWRRYQEETIKESTLLTDLKDIEEKLAESQKVNAIVQQDNQKLTKYYDTNARFLEDGKPKDKFREDVVFKFLHDSVDQMKDSLNITTQHDFIENISFTAGVRNEYGFREWKANITFSFTDETQLIEYIKILVESDEYEIFIHELSYPEFGADIVWSVQVHIPIKFWYQ